MGNFENFNTTLVLGFFDGIHLGHRKVLSSAIEFAKRNNSKTILLTFKKSPSEYFNIKPEYIYSREHNFNVIKNLGIDYIEACDFQELVTQSADLYLKSIVEKYRPIAIFTGFNYTFGHERLGTPELLTSQGKKYNYKYFCIPKYECNSKTISSSLIRNLIKKGNIIEANTYLSEKFFLESTVIEGEKLGRTIGFPTANMIYPNDIVNLHYGVYKVMVMNKSAILNWGIKPTFNGEKPLLEVHIPHYNGDLYGKQLKVEILEKIRDERKFNSKEELRKQIEKDLEICLKSS